MTLNFKHTVRPCKDLLAFNTLSVLENYLIKNYVNDDKTKNKGGNESKKRLRKMCTQVLSLLKKAFCKHDENWRSITKN